VLSVTDRFEITELVTRADALATRRDAEGYAELFTEDAVLDGAEGFHRGTNRLRDDVGPIWSSEGDVSVHLTLNVEVNEVKDRDDSAIVNSVLVILAGDGATALRNVALIEQTVVRVRGSWKISRRTVRPVTPAANS
jgi:ketosteroid isomerase-like protein